MWAFSSELDTPQEPSEVDSTGVTHGQGQSLRAKGDSEATGPPGSGGEKDPSADDGPAGGSDGDGRAGKAETGVGATTDTPAGEGVQGGPSEIAQEEGNRKEGKEGDGEKGESGEEKKDSLWTKLIGVFQRSKGEKPSPPSTVPYYRLFSCADRVDILLLIAGTIGAIAHGSTLPVFYLLFGNVVDALGTNDTSKIPQFALYIVYEAAAVWIASWMGGWQGTGLSDREWASESVENQHFALSIVSEAVVVWAARCLGEWPMPPFFLCFLFLSLQESLSQRRPAACRTSLSNPVLLCIHGPISLIPLPLIPLLRPPHLSSPQPPVNLPTRGVLLDSER